MKITKSQLKQIIKEELKSVLNEVKIVKQGFFKNTNADDIEWEIFDNGRICFETHHEEDYSSTSLCVPLDELKEILGASGVNSPDSMPSVDRNAAAWDFFKRADERSGEVPPEVERRMKNPFKG